MHNGFVPQAEICRGEDGAILMDKCKMINRWRQHCNEHLNGAQAGKDSTLNEVWDAVQQVKNHNAAG